MKVTTALASLCLSAFAVSALPSQQDQITFKIGDHAVEVPSVDAVADQAGEKLSDWVDLAREPTTDDEHRPPHRPHFPRIPHPPVIIDLSQYTIAQLLNDSLHNSEIEAFPGPPHKGPPHSLPLKKLAFLLNISDAETLKETLADENAKLTFLAPSDSALSPPHHHHGDDEHHGPPHHEHGRPEHPPHKGPEHGPPGKRPDHPPHDREDEDNKNSWSSLLGRLMGRSPSKAAKRSKTCTGKWKSAGFADKPDPRAHPFHSEEVLSHLVDRSDSYAAQPDEDKERKKAIIKKIIGFVLRYHLIDSGAYDGRELADKSTIASSLNDTRIRIAPRLFPFPRLVFNFYASTGGPIIKAKNGYVYLLEAPLLPPPPPLETLFIVPAVFSTLTSGVQRVGLDLHSFHHDEDSSVSPIVSQMLEELVKEHELTQFTIFAPTNHAFRKLGFKLNAFLFSIFGRRLLKDILAYHVIKDVTFFSDFNINATSFATQSVAELPRTEEKASKELRKAGWTDFEHHHRMKTDQEDHEGPGGPRKVKVTQYYLTTLFNNTVLPVDVFETRIGSFGRGPLRRSIWIGNGDDRINSRVKVVAPDVVALKGAIHVVDDLVNPFPGPKHHDHDGDHHHEHHGPEHEELFRLWQEEKAPIEDIWTQLLA